jgi:GTP-binding protein Era
VTPAFRAGFVALVGRPNVGKSTLLNRLVGAKLAIVSPRPQTTRTRITGIKTLPAAQAVFVDTPGLQERRGALGELMARTVERTLEDVDLVCVVADAAEGRPPDPTLLDRLAGVRRPVLACLNKVDLVRPKPRLLPLLQAWQAGGRFAEIIPISAARGDNCDRLLDRVARALPEHPPLFPADSTTDQPETFYVAEVIREKLFLFTREEVPYACAVRVEELIERPDPPCLVLRATIYVEQESQKAIVIGLGGRMIGQVGSAARRELERFFGIKVFLGLTVAVRRGWRKNAQALRELGLLQTS